MKNYFEHPGRVVEIDARFKYAMAITLDPSAQYKRGVIRCITSRSGTIGIRGNVDRSELCFVKGDSFEQYSIGGRLGMKNEEEILKQITPPGADFIGFEDPDIWIDEKTKEKHLYFTIPFRMIDEHDEHWTKIMLGHAVGRDLESLTMTLPVLGPVGSDRSGAKEVSIAPLNKQGFRYNLVESSSTDNETHYSTVRVAIAEDMGKPWKFGETVFHPKAMNIPWIGGHASPGPLTTKKFLDVGKGKLLGFMNGREANQKVGEKIKYRIFSIGLFIYDYENGRIDWVSPRSFIRDSEAKTITFASQFIEQGKGRGILYAHVDDSFVRAYTIEAEKIKKLLKNF